MQLQLVGTYSSSDPFYLPLSLADNDGITLEPDGFSAYATATTEGEPVNVSFYLYRPYDAEVTLSLVSGTATAGEDFPATSMTFTIPAYSGGGTFALPTWDDSLVEGPESFQLRLQFTGQYSQSDVYDIPLELGVTGRIMVVVLAELGR